jgi:hypothetical protein
MSKPNRSFLLIIFLLLPFSCPAGSIGGTTPALISVRSSSEQFVIYGSRPDSSGALRRLQEGNLKALTLDPPLVAISCERIKQALLRQLEATDQWRGQVHVVQRRQWPSTANCSLSANRFRDGWSYRLEIPESIEPQRLVEVVTRALLIEMANRNARERSVELPRWLAEGFPPFLEMISNEELVARPPESGSEILPTHRFTRNALLTEDLNDAKAGWAQGIALSVQDLSWPREQLLSGSGLETYRESAQWFVYELLQMKNGAALFRSFLGRLPHYHNWQTAFFAAHNPRIQTPLDLEKWWALQITALNPEIAPRPVALDNSLALLDEVLRAPMQVRVETNDRPMRMVTTLQQALQGLDDPSRRQLAGECLLRLRLARPRLASPILEIADQYQLALIAYLTALAEAAEPDKAGKKVPIKRVDGPVKREVKPFEELIGALNQLDGQRAALAMPSVASSFGGSESGQP